MPPLKSTSDVKLNITNLCDHSGENSQHHEHGIVGAKGGPQNDAKQRQVADHHHWLTAVLIWQNIGQYN